MAVPEVTYEAFKALYGEAVTEAMFGRCLPFAESLVRELCFPNEPEDEGQEDAWGRAVCAAVMADASRGGGHGFDDSASFTLGKFSTSGGGDGAGGTVYAARCAAKRELVGSGLLYMGIGELR